MVCVLPLLGANSLVRIARCPLCPDSDQILHRSEMSRCVRGRTDGIDVVGLDIPPAQARMSAPRSVLEGKQALSTGDFKPPVGHRHRRAVAYLA